MVKLVEHFPWPKALFSSSKRLVVKPESLGVTISTYSPLFLPYPITDVNMVNAGVNRSNTLSSTTTPFTILMCK